jgi:hypothetical protein
MDMRLVKRTQTLFAVLVVCGIALGTMLPVFVEAHYGLLDTPINYQYAKEMRLFKPETYLTLPKFGGRAQLALPIYFFPAQYTVSARVHFVYKTIVCLIMPLLLCWHIVYRVTQRPWLAVCAACAMLANISFAENFYTIFKGEPYILAGMMLSTWASIVCCVLHGAACSFDCSECGGGLGRYLHVFH